MTPNNCCFRWSCSTIAVIAGVILGVLAAFLQITAVITVTPAFLWVVLGVAIGFLAITLATGRCYGCGAERSCTSLHALLFGAIPMDVIPAIVRPIIGNGFVMGVLTVMLLEHVIMK